MEEKAIAILAKKLNLDASTITESMSFTHDLGADDLDVVEYLLLLEDEFHIALVDDNAELFDTVGEVMDYVKSIIK